MRLLLLNTAGFSAIECDNDDLSTFRDPIGCQVFDIANRQIGDVRYDIFCDDEGLLTEEPLVTAVEADGTPMLVGNLIFARHDVEGNTVDLTEDDIHNIIAHGGVTVDRDRAGMFLRTRTVVVCEY